MQPLNQTGADRTEPTYDSTTDLNTLNVFTYALYDWINMALLNNRRLGASFSRLLARKGLDSCGDVAVILQALPTSD